MTLTVSMILDIVIISLLVPTIFFAVILNNRLGVLRKNREELARLVAAFNEATARAESGIPRLRKISEDASKALQEKAERAQILRDDLAFMIERGDSMASRLESAVRQGRSEDKSGPKAPAAFDIETAAEAAEKVKSQFGDRERAATDTPPLSASKGGAAGSRGSKSRQPLGAALAGEVSSTLRAERFGDDERSEAERELLRALQSAR